MLTSDQLKQALHSKGLSKTDAVLLCLAAAGGQDVPPLEIRALAVQSGMRGAKDLNVGALLHSATGRAFKTPKGWELTDVGRQHVAQIATARLSISPAAVQAQTLRGLLPAIKSADAREFLTEAVVCAESSLFRAAVVLSWVGAVAVLQDVVVASHLAAFNAAAQTRDAKWKTAKNADDLGRMKEFEFLQILEDIKIVGKNVRQELEACLKLRNGCGHPNSLKVGHNKVAAHLETLAQNVFAPHAT